MMMKQKLDPVTRKYVHTGPDGHRGPLAPSLVTRERKIVNDSARVAIPDRSDAKMTNSKQRLVMPEMVSSTPGQHLLNAVPHAREAQNQGLEPTHAQSEKMKQSPATQILEHTTHGVHGRLARKLAEEVHRTEGEIILVEIPIKPKSKLVIQIQVHGVNGQHGASAQLHVEEGLKPGPECIRVQDRQKPELKCATHILVPSGVDGHSGVSAVPLATREQG